MSTLNMPSPETPIENPQGFLVFDNVGEAYFWHLQFVLHKGKSNYDQNYMILMKVSFVVVLNVVFSVIKLI